MTSQSALEALFKLTSHAAADAARLEEGRPRDRSPLLAFEADVPLDGMAPATIENRFGDTRTGINITLQNVNASKAVTPVERGSTQTLFIPVSQGTKVNPHSEAVQMSDSIAVATGGRLDNIGDLRGCHIVAEETVHEFTGRKTIHSSELDGAKALELGIDLNRKPDDQGRYWYNSPMNVRYYRVTSVTPKGAANGNGATAAQAADVTQNDLDGISNFLANVGDGYESLTNGNVLIQLKSFNVNVDQPEIQKAWVAKSLRQFLADRTAQPVTA